MSPHPNPVHKRGKRNSLCPHYRDCLNKAVKNAWKFWDCYACDYSKAKQLMTDAPFVSGDTVPYYYVSSEIGLKV